MEMILLAGGLGTRLKNVVADIPKPMAEVAGKPFLAHVFEWAVRQGITHAVLAVAYKYETIKSYFGDNYHGLLLTYSVEREPLGTGGGMRLAMERTSSAHVFACNADTLFSINLQMMKALHTARGYTITIAGKKVNDSSRYGFLKLSGTRVVGFSEKNEIAEGLVNGGVYLLDRNLFEGRDINTKFSFEQDILANCKNMGVYESDGYFIDIGIPEDYEKARRDLQ